MRNQKHILFITIVFIVFLFSYSNKVSADTVVPILLPFSAGNSSNVVLEKKYNPAKFELGVKAEEKSEQEIKKLIKTDPYKKDDGEVGNLYLKGDDLNRLPNISKLLKSYPHLQINDVNAKGDYVGCLSRSDYDVKRAFANIKGKQYIIGSVAGIFACATGINDNGDVVGYYDYREGVSRGFLWKKNKLTKLPLLKINESAMPERINNKGIIVGMASVGRPNGISEESHAVQWVNVKIKDLGIPEDSDIKYCGWAFDINNYGQVLVDCGGRPAMWYMDKMYYFDDLVSDLEIGERFDTFIEDEFNRNFFSDNSLFFRAVKCSYKPQKPNEEGMTYSCDYRRLKVSIPRVPPHY
ncbi:MAG: hypothetical protein WCV83_00965 [Candidatus Magasanikbacteria bacterium]